MKNWGSRLAKIEAEMLQNNKSEMLDRWIQSQDLPSDWTYLYLHSLVPVYFKGECMKRILQELYKL